MKKKSLSAKKEIVKQFNFKKILKDKRIFEVYKVFEKEFGNLNYSNNIALAVSGGPDSLALCFLISCFKSKKNNDIKPKFYLVDHNLRNNSAEEAKLVKKCLKSKKINLKILKWKGKKPSSNLQSIARKKRYELLFNECKKNNIKTILTAHHEDDFYETFFSRLLRGSGTEGLSSFMEIEKKFFFQENIITLVRPLLNLNKQDLLYVSKNIYNFYIEDPSNQMDKFERVRLRNLILSLKKQGLNFNKLKLTLNNLSSTNRAIKEMVNRNISENVYFNKEKYLISSNFFLQPEEVVFRSLSTLIKKISEKVYPPRGKKMVKFINELKNNDQFKGTLGGAIIEKVHNSVVVTREKTKKS